MSDGVYVWSIYVNCLCMCIGHDLCPVLSHCLRCDGLWLSKPAGPSTHTHTHPKETLWESKTISIIRMTCYEIYRWTPPLRLTQVPITRQVQHKSPSVTYMRLFPQGVQPRASGGLCECLWYWCVVCVPVSCCCNSGLKKQIVCGESDRCCSSESPVILECPEERRSKCAGKGQR